MKLFVKILIAVGVLIATPFVIALFVKNEYVVEREIVINKPRQEVFAYVKQLKNQDQYNCWTMADPNMKKEFTGTDGTVGFVYAWDGDENAGKGEQEIIYIAEDEKLETELRFIKPFEGLAYAHWILQPGADSAKQTIVKWGMKGNYSYPMNFMNLFLDGMLGKDLYKSLTILKSTLEK